MQQTPTALRRFEDEEPIDVFGQQQSDDHSDLDADLDAEDISYDEYEEKLRERRDRAAELLALRYRVSAVASAITDASSAVGRAAGLLRELLVHERAEDALSMTPGLLSSHLDGLHGTVRDLVSLFPASDLEPVEPPTPAPTKKTKR